MSEEIRDGQSIILVPKILVTTLRENLGDSENENETTEGRAFSDQKLASFIVDVINDFNVATPELTQRLDMVNLFSSFSTIKPQVLDAAMSRALKMEATRKMRNEMPYQAGSVNFDPNANGRTLLELADRMWVEWSNFRNRKKIEMNIGNGFGGGNGGYQVAHSDLLSRSVFDTYGTISVVGSLI
jgi:hypothetical protein